MIKAAEFIQAFDATFADGARDAGLLRQRSKTSKWLLKRAAGDLTFQFRVDPKASALPHCPGALWAEVHWNGPRYNDRDDGTVSYYQYTTDADNASIHERVKAVIEKVRQQDAFDNEALRVGRDAMLAVIDAGLHLLPEARVPNYPLYYYDERDGADWGAWFAQNIRTWLQRFEQAPETMEAWAWRVLWKDLPRTP